MNREHIVLFFNVCQEDMFLNNYKKEYNYNEDRDGSDACMTFMPRTSHA